MFGADEQKCPRLPLFAGRAAQCRSWVGLRALGRGWCSIHRRHSGREPFGEMVSAVAGRCRHPPGQLFDGDRSVHALCGIEFVPLQLPLGGPVLPGSPLDPDQVCPGAARPGCRVGQRRSRPVVP